MQPANNVNPDAPTTSTAASVPVQPTTEATPDASAATPGASKFMRTTTGASNVTPGAPTTLTCAANFRFPSSGTVRFHQGLIFT